jgi:Plavaka transposase
MICADGKLRHCFPVFCGWIADYSENVSLHSIRKNYCPRCEAPKSSFGDAQLSTRIQLPRDFTTYFEHLIIATDPTVHPEDRKEAVEYLNYRGVQQNEGVFWSAKCVGQTNLVTPDVLHTVYLGILKHMMDWIVGFLEYHKLMDRFNKLWLRVPPYPGLLQFGKPYTAISQWQGKEMKALGKIILPVFAATLSNLGPTTTSTQKSAFKEAILCIKALVNFHLMSQYRSHTDATLQYMSNYLDDFHSHKDVFKRFRAGKTSKKLAAALRTQLSAERALERDNDETFRRLSKNAKDRCLEEDRIGVETEVEAALKQESHFNFVKMHLLAHFTEHIRDLGHLSNFSAELPEALHRDLKNAFRHSNKINTGPQILRSISRKQAFDYRELNTEAVKRYPAGSNPPPVARNRRLQNKRTDVRTLCDLAAWCSMSVADLQNHIAWCLKRFYDWDEYVTCETSFQLLYDAKYERYDSVIIPVPSFQDVDTQDVHIIRCTGKRAWRKLKLPRNDTVLLWTGTGSSDHFKSSRGRIPARVDCLFHVVMTQIGKPLNVCLALITSLVPGPIKKTEGMMIVEEQVPLVQSEPFTRGGRRRQPQTGIGSRYIVPVSAIQSAAHLIPLEPSSKNTRWYLNNTIDLSTFNLLY